ncbi:MAG: hypothetical protein WAW80_01565 [Candidatus Saccharimonadales bacterium]
MRHILFGLFLSVVGVAVLQPHTASALLSDPKLFISADNTFYSYVKGGETLSATFLRVNQDEPFDTVRGDVTVTIDGPGITQQKCVIPKDVAIGSGCRFATLAAPETGIWRIQFAVPADARTYMEVSPVVKWAKNLFNWNITVNDGSTEQTGRTWTERYAIRQPAAASYIDDFTNYYISEDGYIYKAVSRGYNGQISTLSADSVGIRSGDKCVSVYRSTDVGDSKFSPALGTCGNGYKLFFEEPSGELPTKATKWDKTTDWIRPNINRPTVSELHFTSDNSVDQQSGKISFFLRNFIGQYQIKIDTNGDGSFDGQDDVVLNEQMKKLSNGLQEVHFDGVDKTGQIIPPTEKIGIKVDITKVAEIHLVAADVEGRTGGIELTRLSGDNAPTTRICWNDTELSEMPSNLITKIIDGTDCPDSVGSVHEWAYADSSWGNARYIDDWIYASAKLVGDNEISYPNDTELAVIKKDNNMIAVVASVVVVVLIVAIAIIIILRKRQTKAKQLAMQQAQQIQSQQQISYTESRDDTAPPRPPEY